MPIDFPASPSVGAVFSSGGVSWIWNGTTWTTSGNPSVAGGAANKLINPFMEIDQVNEGAALTNAQNGGYVVDGFSFSAGFGAWTIARSTDAPPGYPNSLLLTVTATGVVAAGSYSQMLQTIEADELADTGFGTASARTVSVAFWVKSSVTGTYSAALINAAGNRSYTFNFTISAAATWQLITQTIPGDTSGTWVVKGNAKGADLRVAQVVGTNFQGAANTWGAGTLLGTSSNSNTFFNTNGATFQLGPCGLWVAPAPQPLLRTSIQSELSRCQRYYEKSYDLGTAVGTAFTAGAGQITYGMSGSAASPGAVTAFAVPKRAAPTITFYDAAGAANKISNFTSSWANGAALAATYVNTKSLYAQGGGAALFISYAYTADIRL